jgi:UDP-N-acetylmuramyl tripeptide synthase
MFTLGAVGALRHKRAFTEATLAEIRSVREVTGRETVFQIEVPAELVLLAKAPVPARPTLAKLLARPIKAWRRRRPSAPASVFTCVWAT